MANSFSQQASGPAKDCPAAQGTNWELRDLNLRLRRGQISSGKSKSVALTTQPYVVSLEILVVKLYYLFYFITFTLILPFDPQACGPCLVRQRTVRAYGCTALPVTREEIYIGNDDFNLPSKRLYQGQRLRLRT